MSAFGASGCRAVIIRSLVGLLLLGTLAKSTFAQTVDPILEEERRRQLEQRTNELGTLERRGGAPAPGPTQARLGPCFQIDQLIVKDVTLLSPEELAAITSKYVPRCMQGADIQAVMREIDAVYADRGYITSKTYIPPQNLQDKQLVLVMLEGKVEDIFLIDAEKQIESKRGTRQIQTAFPNRKGGLFQLRDFEQGLDQMNRLASVEAILKLQPGEEAGGSYVIVQRLQQDRVRGYARLDNQGSESTGRNTLSLDLEVDDLFGANDTWTFGYSGAENSNALSMIGSVPYGYWTFETELAYSEYLTPLNALSELFGTSRTAGLKARKVVFRDQTTTREISFGLRLRNSDRFINDVRLTPQNLSTLSLGIKQLQLGRHARHSYDATLNIGTRLFGADKDASDIGADIPHAQFVKVNAGWQRQGALGNIGTLVTDLRAQWSPDTLYGSEQLSLGSYSTVRGYDASVASGDMGGYVRNDLYLASGIWNFLPAPSAEKVARKLQTHAFFDAGLTYDRARKVREKAAGVGLGLSYYHKNFTLSGLIGVPLIKDNRFGEGAALFQVRVDMKTW